MKKTGSLLELGWAGFLPHGHNASGRRWVHGEKVTVRCQKHSNQHAVRRSGARALSCLSSLLGWCVCVVQKLVFSTDGIDQETGQEVKAPMVPPPKGSVQRAVVNNVVNGKDDVRVTLNGPGCA